MRRKLRTVLVGLGQMGAGYADDPMTARHYRFTTHAQVLASHPAFVWEAAVDRDPVRLERVRTKWGVRVLADSVQALAGKCRPEVAVIATPPGERIGVLESLPDLRAVLVEKPLGLVLAESREFLELCSDRRLLAQVNLWRRCDERLCELASGGLRRHLGAPQAAFALYGNGLNQNGIHLIDLVRMLLGEIRSVQALAGIKPRAVGSLAGDMDLPFCVRTTGDLAITFQPLRFERYREVALDIWGEEGRVAIIQEGLAILHFPLETHRALTGEREVASDRPRELTSTVGEALFRVYDNLAAAVLDGAALLSPAKLALEAQRVIESVLQSEATGCSVVELR
jgi:predicted dehydrogenase